MQNITPEDREWWDKAMARHARRQRKLSPAVRFIIRPICVGIVAGIIIALVTAHYFPSPETRNPEITLNDTLQMNAGDISRDSTLDAMKKTDAGREYDSLVKRRAEQ